nr:hypothetical protein [uncultured Chitinophaga sp.]
MRIGESKRHNISALIKKGIDGMAAGKAAEGNDKGIRNFQELLEFASLTDLSEDADFHKSTLHKKIVQPQLMKIEECIKLAEILYVTPQHIMSLALNEMKWKPAKKSV